MTITDITLPDGAKPTVDRDFVIANISAPSSLRSADDEDEDATGEETADGEADTEADAEGSEE